MKSDQKKERKKTNRILGLIFVGIVIVLFAVNLIKRDADISGRENRALAQRPALTWESVRDGSFAEQFESYATDQFAARDFFHEIDAGFYRITGLRQEGNVFRGRKRQLMEDIVVPDSGTLSQEAEGINRYAASHPEVSTHILLVPDSAEILRDRLPRFASTADQVELFDELHAQLDGSIIWMDAAAAMRDHPDEKLYYQTDTYWTTEGAYQVFLETAADLGIEDPKEVTYDICCAAYDYNGRLAGESGFLLGQKEEVDIFLPQEATSYLVTYVDEAKKSPSLYDAESLDTRDQYDVFLGGDHSLVEIDTGADSSRVLLVVKDSFANCYIPFLIPYYSKIIVADPDLYEGGIEDLTDSYDVTDTLFLYGGNSFFTDTELEGFFEENSSNFGN